MSRITIVTRLRLVAAIAPVVLLIASPIIAVGFYLFGITPALMHENEFAAMHAADGLEATLFRLDWARTRPDAPEIIKGQERRFVTLLDTARIHATSPDQLAKVEQITHTANPVFGALRKESAGDETTETKFQELEGQILDLAAATDAATAEATDRVQSRSRIFIAISLVAGLVVPWAVYFSLYQLGGQLAANLRGIRDQVEKLSESGTELKEIDEQLASLGFPKPNPMFAE